MGNTRSSGTNHEYATVHENSGAVGYFTNPIDVRLLYKNDKVSKIFFSVRETDLDVSAAASALSTITVLLQFKCPGDLGWTDYVDFAGNELAIGNRVILEDIGVGVLWRAGVVSDGFTSGSVTFGFDW